ncbi:MAG: hypothetical protein HZC55_27160 [Verrucomicrobia bacterium]|nr:hypothetical protein [Verrucomicrobiota bacterium]
MTPRLLLPLSLVLAPAALTQTLPTAAVTGSAAPAGEILELSPFQVTAEAFKGYYASQTLAGSRLKMNVDEIASSVQILTPEFMQDVGATNLNELFLFTTSTEASGINGNFSDFNVGTTSTGDQSSRVNPQGSQRVRGIAGADLTRNYFLTAIPSDRYNTELTEINRGANAILFGLGSPAGIVNTQLAAAKFKDAHQVRVEADSAGTFRAEVDLNRVLIPKKLAVRFASVRDDTRYYQEPAFDNDHRQFGAVTLRPWQGGTVRGFVESGGRHANRPNTIPPASTIASWLANQPLMVQRMRAVISATPGANLTVPDNYPLIYSPIAQSWRPTGTSNAYLTTASIPNDMKLAILRNAVIYHDNNATNPRILFHPNMSRQIAAVYQPGSVHPGGAVGGGGAIESNITAIANPLLAMNPDGVGAAPAYNYLVPEQPWRTNPVQIPVSLTNLAMFDFTRRMLSGDASFQNDKWTHHNVVFEQTALRERIGLEVAYDQQMYRRSAYVPFQNFSGIFVDLMQDYLGQPNPNLGRPFVMDRVGMGTVQDERESFRATAFAKLDPARQWPDSRIARWLGRHTLTGIFSTYDQKEINASWGQYYQNPPGGFVFSAADPLGSSRRKVNNIVYLGDSVLGARSETDIRLTPPTPQKLWNPGRAITLRTFNTTTAAYETLTLQTDAEMEDLSHNTQNVDTHAATWNVSFLRNHLIALYGWRQDSVVSEIRQALPGADLLADPSSIHTPAALLNRIDDTFRTTSWSLVGKWPERWVPLPLAARVNAYYGQSENFSLGATANDFYGAQLPSPSGRTREYGLMFNLLDSKFVVRLNRYECEVANSGANTKYGTLVNQGILKPFEFLIEAQRLGNQGAATPNYALAMEALGRLNAIIPARTRTSASLDAPAAGGDYARTDLPNLGDTQDVVGRGTEVELTWNPTENWRMALNVANQETVIDNYGPRLAELWAKVEPILGSGGLIGHLRYFNDPNTVPPNYISHPAPVPGDTQMTVAQWIETNVLSSYRNQKKQEGRVSNEQRAWRVNLVTNYSFTQGLFRGFGVGTAVRWQDGAVIGYPTELVGDTLVADINHPHVAPAITNIDAWVRYKRRMAKGRIDWTVELRVQNLNHTAQDLIPVRSELTTAYRVAQYRVGPPRVWSLSNSFKF